MRIGLFGGSFNPVHQGHLQLAREALSELCLDRVIFVPSHLTPLKEPSELLPAAFRVRLLKAALASERRFLVSDCELRRKGVSYTVETLRYFKKKYGAKTTLFFLAGSDALKNLPRWKSLRRVFELCCFVILKRSGYPFRPNPSWPALFMPLEAPDVSSSDIRRRLREGRSIRGLVPAAAERLLRAYFRKTRRGVEAVHPA